MAFFSVVEKWRYFVYILSRYYSWYCFENTSTRYIVYEKSVLYELWHWTPCGWLYCLLRRPLSEGKNSRVNGRTQESRLGINKNGGRTRNWFLIHIIQLKKCIIPVCLLLFPMKMCLFRICCLGELPTHYTTIPVRCSLIFASRLHAASHDITIFLASQYELQQTTNNKRKKILLKKCCI